MDINKFNTNVSNYLSKNNNSENIEKIAIIGAVLRGIGSLARSGKNMFASTRPARYLSKSAPAKFIGKSLKEGWSAPQKTKSLLFPFRYGKTKARMAWRKMSPTQKYTTSAIGAASAGAFLGSRLNRPKNPPENFRYPNPY